MAEVMHSLGAECWICIWEVQGSIPSWSDFLPLNLDFGLAGAISPFAFGKRRAGQIVLRDGAQGPDCRFQACLKTWLHHCAPGRFFIRVY